MHASSTLPAFVLSQNQTLHKEILRPRAAPSRARPGRWPRDSSRAGSRRGTFAVPFPCLLRHVRHPVSRAGPPPFRRWGAWRRRVANLLYRAMAFGFQRARGSVRLGGRLLPGRPRGSAAALGGRCLSCGDGSVLYTRGPPQRKRKFSENAFCLQLVENDCSTNRQNLVEGARHRDVVVLVHPEDDAVRPHRHLAVVVGRCLVEAFSNSASRPYLSTRKNEMPFSTTHRICQSRTSGS